MNQFAEHPDRVMALAELHARPTPGKNVKIFSTSL